MQERNRELRPELRFQVMDVTDMSELESCSFDIAIDKSTIDALLCGRGGALKVAKMLNETQRVLKPETGVYFAVSFGGPSCRSFHLKRPFLSLELREIFIEERFHHVYIA